MEVSCAGLLVALPALITIVYAVSRIDIIKVWNNWLRLFEAQAEETGPSPSRVNAEDPRLHGISNEG